MDKSRAVPVEVPKQADPKKAMDKRHMARIAAVQALFAYMFEPKQQEQEEVAQYLVKHYYDRRNRDANTITPDKRFLKKLFSGATEHVATLDDIIARYLSKDWTVATLDPVLLAILRAGTYELTFLGDIPPKVVINEYVEVTQHYFSDVECRLVNAVLDAMYKAKQSH